MNKQEKNLFVENYKIDYKKLGIAEQKDNFDYISWSHVQKIMRTEYPTMSWQMLWNENTNSYNWSGFVRLVFKIDNIEVLDMPYPILNFNFKPIANPDSFDINKAMMRGYAKGFAMLTGHGLSLYTGEDLIDIPEQEKKLEVEKPKTKATIAKKNSVDKEKIVDLKKYLLKHFSETKNLVGEELVITAKNKLAEIETKGEVEATIVALKKKYGELNEGTNNE